MRQAYRHCEQLVREADKDRFLASLFAPPDRRPALHALYAFDIEIARVRALSRQPLPGEIRLQWWRDVLHGERTGEATANPVAAALLDTIECAALSRKPLLELIDARAFDLYDEPMRTLEELETYCQTTSGHVLASAAHIVDPAPGPAVAELAAHTSVAAATTALLRTFALHASRRQLYVPVEILQRHGVSADDIHAGRPSPGLPAALGELRGHARRHLKKAHDLMPATPRSTWAAFLPVVLVPLYLDRMEHADYDPFRTAIDVPQWRRQWALWRAAARRI
jgi:15-cis-phytoene synthase